MGKKKKSRFGIDTFILGPAGALVAGAKLSEVISPELVPFLAFCGLVFPAALLLFRWASSCDCYGEIGRE